MDLLVSMPVALPALAAGLALAPSARARGLVVRVAAALLGAAALALAWRAGHSPMSAVFGGETLSRAVVAFDFALLTGVALAALVRMKDVTSGVLAGAQAAGLFVLTRFVGLGSATDLAGLAAGPLPIASVLAGSLTGALAAVLALGIMPNRERRLDLSKTRQPRFFFFLLLSLGAGNGLMLADNLLWLHFFWILSTVCASALMAHDGDEGARQGGACVLRTNLAGGAALFLGLVLLHRAGAPLSIGALAALDLAQARLPLPMFLLCAAGLAASAQVPFLGWLRKCASAPAPALVAVHCATLAPAGAFLVFRLCPAFQGTMLSGLLALAGAFTFFAASALAVGHSDAGRALARSTSAALGLALACAGINTPAAVTAGLLILVFHAVSKALLFACLAIMEEKTGLRDVADMGRLFAVLPRTALAALAGVFSMFLPPFGLALGFWMAFESAVGARSMPALLLMALGAGLWALLWTRWAGVLLRSLRLGGAPSEDLAPDTRIPLAALGVGAVGLSLCSPPLYKALVEPAVRGSYKAVGFALRSFSFVGEQGVFPVYLLFAVLGVAAVLAWRAAASRSQGTGGESRSDLGAPPEDEASPDAAFALDGLFDETRLAGPINTAGLVLLAVMLGAVWGGLV